MVRNGFEILLQVYDQTIPQEETTRKETQTRETRIVGLLRLFPLETFGTVPP
jgi:hypothetical protein